MPVKTTSRLFDYEPLSQFLEYRWLDLANNIKSEGKDEIRNNSDVVAARLLKKYSLELVRVDKDSTLIDKEEHDPHYRELTISYSVPFTGSRKLLWYHPSSYTSELVYGSISDGRIVVDIENAAGNDEPFQREFDSWYVNMEKWLEGANSQANSFNKSLSGRIKNRIDERLQAIRSADDVGSALGYAEIQDASERGAEPAGDMPPEAGHTVDLTIPEREDIRNEFKEIFSVPVKDEPNKVKMAVAKTVAAFANTEGGRLFIGVNNDGKSVGLKRDLGWYKNSTDELELAIRNFVTSKLKGPVCMVFGFSREDYLVIRVAKRRRGWVYVDGKFYVREGNRSRELNAQEAAEYQDEHRPE